MPNLPEFCPELPDGPNFYRHAGEQNAIRGIPCPELSDRDSNTNTHNLADLDISYCPWVVALAIAQHRRNLEDIQANIERHIRSWETWGEEIMSAEAKRRDESAGARMDARKKVG